MDWFTGIIVFILVWWLAIFAVLPFGHERDEDGTPKFPHLKRKAMITTGLSILIWCGLYVLIESGLISFRDMAMEMPR